MAELMKLDPAFEALLREVASEPESRLLRAPRGREVPRWLSLDAPASVGDMDLGRAERELVRVGREELAWLFRQAALREYIDGDRTRGDVIRGRSVDMRNCPMPRDQIAVAAEEFEPGDDEDAFAVLTRWFHEKATTRPTAAALAAASMRVVPTQHARAIAGSDYLVRGDTASGEEWLMSCLATRAESERSVASWNNIALAQLRKGRVDRSISATRRALSIAPDDLLARCGLLVCAVMQSNGAAVREAARELDALHQVHGSSMDVYVATLRSQRSRGRLLIPVHSAALAKKHAGDFGVGGRILHELE